MKAVVLYESMYGNTATIAHEIGRGLRDAGAETEVIDVTDAPEDGPQCDLLVVGGPTHVASLSRPRTRTSAVEHGADEKHARTGIREWIEGARASAGRTATFDTRIESMRHWPGSAAKTARRKLRRHDLPRADEVESFWVREEKGPLLDGETQRARDWGTRLARSSQGS